MLEDHLRGVVQATFAWFLRVLEESLGHLVDQLFALEVLLLHDPIAALGALVRVVHQRVGASTTLVEPVVGEARVALALGD